MEALMLLLVTVQAGEQRESLFARTIRVGDKEIPQFRHNIQQSPRTGVVRESVDWTSIDLQRNAYLQFYKDLPFPVFKTEGRAEQEAILKRMVHRLLEKQIPPGTPVEKAELYLLEKGFRSARRASWLPQNTINLYGREQVRNGLFDWNNLFVINVDIRFDAGRRVTDIIVNRAVYTYPHKGV
jgi:hypothetical protein